MNESSSQISQRFWDAFKGNKNFMTPNVIERGQVGNYFYELSQGTGMRSNDIFGVTVIDKNNKRVDKLSSLFDSISSARMHLSFIEVSTSHEIEPMEDEDPDNSTGIKI